MVIRERAKYFVTHEHQLLLTIEKVSDSIGVSPNTIRSQISRERYNSLDASTGQRGSRVLFSPSDLVQLAVISKLTHLGMYFRGKSSIERKFLLPDGSKPPQHTSEDELLGRVVGNVKIFIYNMAGVWPDDNVSPYFVAYYDPNFYQVVNGVKHITGIIKYEQCQSPLDVPKQQQDGLMAVFDCSHIAKQVINALPRG